MRLIASMLTVAALGIAGPAAAAWSEYPQPKLGFILEFPSAPTESSGTYKTVLVDPAPVHVLTVKQDDTVFVASVVDLQNRAGDGASLLIEAEFNLNLLGNVRDNSTSRVEPNKDAVYGRFITIDCKSGRIPDQPGQTEAAHQWFKAITGGVECPDGGRLVTNMFFHRGRMYLLQGINLPGKADTGGPLALRFANSLSFYNAEGKRSRADNVQ